MECNDLFIYCTVGGHLTNFFLTDKDLNIEKHYVSSNHFMILANFGSLQPMISTLSAILPINKNYTSRIFLM